ncbi:MAG: hypothetical protein CVU05_00315 [Bacteroidetes bacterium HGW-Bacteroidetes-21]|nr:MAG: hypothetical protein CVU05_00315 [Bacteroidetes bacterium HGW-Bacteroidetes-21]
MSLTSFSQSYRLSIGSSQIYLPAFDNKPFYFYGASWQYTFLLNRFGIYFGMNYYVPKNYYGTVRNYSFDEFDYKSVKVNARGGGNTFDFGISYDVIRSKSEKLKIAPEFGITIFSHNATYNKDPYIRIYGSAYDISASVFTLRTGINTIFKLGNTPITCTLSRCNRADKMEYDSFQISSFYEIKIGVAFPILVSTPPNQIKRISYE